MNAVLSNYLINTTMTHLGFTDKDDAILYEMLGKVDGISDIRPNVDVGFCIYCKQMDKIWEMKWGHTDRKQTHRLCFICTFEFARSSEEDQTLPDSKQEKKE